MPKLQLLHREVTSVLETPPSDPDAICALEKAFVGELDATAARATQNAQLLPNMARLLVPSVHERRAICEQMNAQMNGVLSKLSQFNGYVICLFFHGAFIFSFSDSFYTESLTLLKLRWRRRAGKTPTEARGKKPEMR